MQRISVWVMMALVLGLLVARPANAMTMPDCEMTPTIVSLHHCVHHAVEMGVIDNPGIAESLLAKLNAAHAAQERGQTQTAISMLKTFISEVRSLSGNGISAMHAEHMVMHAQAVIRGLSGTA